MKSSLLIILIYFSTLPSFGQKNDYRPGQGLKLTYTYSGLNTIDIGFGKGKMKTMEEMIGARGFYGGFVNLGYGFRNNESLLTTKASFEFATMVFGARMNLINYTGFKSNQISFLPEIGFSYSGIFSIMYGYNVFLTANKFDLNRHSFSLSVTPYWKDRTRKK
jgi:hypothetical protein